MLKGEKFDASALQKTENKPPGGVKKSRLVAIDFVYF